MNAQLLKVLKEIVVKYGETILSEPRRVSSLLADLAHDEPRAQKNLFIKCLEYGAAETLKNVPESELDRCKQQLAQKLHDEDGLDLGLCGEALDLLAAVLFGGEQNVSSIKPEPAKPEPIKPQPVKPEAAKTSQSQNPPKPKPAAPTPSAKTVDLTDGCNGCGDNKKNTCNFYGCGISEASGYDCGMKVNDPDAEKLRKKRKSKKAWGWVLYFSFLLFCWISSSYTPLWLYLASLFPWLFSGSLSWWQIFLIVFGIYWIIEIIKANNRKQRRKNAKRLSP